MRGTHEKSKTGHVERKRFPSNVACFVIWVRHPSSGPGCARSTFPVGEGILPAGVTRSRSLSGNWVSGSPSSPGPGPLSAGYLVVDILNRRESDKGIDTLGGADQGEYQHQQGDKNFHPIAEFANDEFIFSYLPFTGYFCIISLYI